MIGKLKNHETSQTFWDDKGNASWMRKAGAVVLFVLIVGTVLLYLDWRMVLMTELAKEQPDYEGVNSLFQSMMIGFIGGVFVTFAAKIIQKKYENAEPEGSYLKETNDENENDLPDSGS